MSQVEEWRDIPGYEGVYQVSDQGRVKRIQLYSYAKTHRERLVRDRCTHTGYHQITLSVKNVRYDRYIHKLVALAFIPNPDEKLEVNHKDGNKDNNSVENLEWCTRKENCIHQSQVLGYKPPRNTHLVGEDHPQAKISNDQVKEIRSLYLSGNYSYKSLGAMYSVSGSQIGRIVNYRHRKN